MTLPAGAEVLSAAAQGMGEISQGRMMGASHAEGWNETIMVHARVH